MTSLPPFFIPTAVAQFEQFDITALRHLMLGTPDNRHFAALVKESTASRVVAQNEKACPAYTKTGTIKLKTPRNDSDK